MKQKVNDKGIIQRGEAYGVHEEGRGEDPGGNGQDTDESCRNVLRDCSALEERFEDDVCDNVIVPKEGKGRRDARYDVHHSLSLL